MQPHFDGATLQSGDHPRLQTALSRVWHLMRDGQWRTLREVADAVGCSESGASARLRDLRKTKFSRQHPTREVQSRRAAGGLWRYRVVALETYYVAMTDPANRRRDIVAVVQHDWGRRHEAGRAARTLHPQCTPQEVWTDDGQDFHVLGQCWACGQPILDSDEEVHRGTGHGEYLCGTCAAPDAAYGLRLGLKPEELH